MRGMEAWQRGNPTVAKQQRVDANKEEPFLHATKHKQTNKKNKARTEVLIA